MALPACMDALIVWNRFIGSLILVARSALIAPTALAESISPGLRSDTGTIDFKDWAGNSP